MISVMVKYRVKKDKVELVRKAIVQFVEAVARYESGTLAYDAFQEDETGFVHLMTFKNDQARKAHEIADYTNRFVDMLYPNCEKEPVFTELTPLKSNRY
jgi:quinol monooxygenase YgiN